MRKRLRGKDLEFHQTRYSVRRVQALARQGLAPSAISRIIGAPIKKVVELRFTKLNYGRGDYETE